MCKKILKAIHKGELKIGEMIIPCAVLEDGTRVIHETSIIKNFGSIGGKNYKLREKSNIGPMPLFLSSIVLQPFIYGVFTVEDLKPIIYTTDGKNRLKSFDATIAIFIKLAINANQVPFLPSGA